ncbi:hypothetical protein [Candidatus Pelagibacter sp. Uisw_134_02]|uniref:hypothetical protein n=1 Tax=Candidatus Pelagibacter sp. Uisw_134_02 TaxID=3230990 RepID=UPI0039EA8E96
MKRLLLILILTFSFQTLSKADDIRDFEIEGMSIGDSLLDYFTKDEIISAADVAYNNDEFYGKEIDANNDVYQRFSFTLKKGDNKFLIYQLKGLIFVSHDKCTKMKKDVVNDIKKVLNDFSENNYKGSYKEAYGKSFAEVTDLEVKGGSIRVWCDTFDKNLELTKYWDDSLSIDASNDEYLEWLNNKAYQ